MIFKLKTKHKSKENVRRETKMRKGKTLKKKSSRDNDKRKSVLVLGKGKCKKT